MSASERGVYISLIVGYYEYGPLPANLHVLAKLLALNRRTLAQFVQKYTSSALVQHVGHKIALPKCNGIIEATSHVTQIERKNRENRYIKKEEQGEQPQNKQNDPPETPELPPDGYSAADGCTWKNFADKANLPPEVEKILLERRKRPQ